MPFTNQGYIHSLHSVGVVIDFLRPEQEHRHLWCVQLDTVLLSERASWPFRPVVVLNLNLFQCGVLLALQRKNDGFLVICFVLMAHDLQVDLSVLCFKLET